MLLSDRISLFSARLFVAFTAHCVVALNDHWRSPAHATCLVSTYHRQCSMCYKVELRHVCAKTAKVRQCVICGVLYVLRKQQ